MSYFYLVLAAIFLPLFPFSMLFNYTYARLNNAMLKGILILAWPQVGLFILSSTSVDIPSYLMLLAICTSILYAVRVLTLRDIGTWISFIATSTWSLMWLFVSSDITYIDLQKYTLGISLPLLLLVGFASGLEARFGAAYIGLYRGLADAMPKFSGIFVMTVLAVIATPIFPTFFVMLFLVLTLFPVKPLIALGVIIVWLLWSWAGARLISGLIVGRSQQEVPDIDKSTLWVGMILLAGLVVMALYGVGAKL